MFISFSHNHSYMLSRGKQGKIIYTTLDSQYARFEENPGDRSFESNVLCLSLLNPKSFEWLPGFLY